MIHFSDDEITHILTFSEFICHLPAIILYVDDRLGLKCFCFPPQLTKMNVEAQHLERELRDELADCVTKAASDADRARIGQLEAIEAQLRTELSKYCVAKITTLQYTVSFLNSYHNDRLL